jgi:hypothetical protein
MSDPRDSMYPTTNAHVTSGMYNIIANIITFVICAVIILCALALL